MSSSGSITERIRQTAGMLSLNRSALGIFAMVILVGMGDAPDYCRGAMFGLYYLIRDFFVAAAALVGALIWLKSPQYCLIAAFLFGIAGTLGYAFFGTDLSSKPLSKDTQ